jgi:hypothetical protein
MGSIEQPAIHDEQLFDAERHRGIVRRSRSSAAPDSSRFSVPGPVFNLGVSASGIGIFSVYRTNGKQIRVINARAFEPEERFFYQRKVDQTLNQ